MKKLTSLLSSAKRLAEYIAASIFFVLFLVFLAQITMRFIFNQPLPWSDELIVVLYISMVFWGTATLVKEREHVALDLVYNVLPANGKRCAAIVGALLMACLFFWALPYCYDYISYMHRERTPVAGIRFSYVFAPFLFCVLVIAVRYLVRFFQLLGRHWQQHI